jgi:hypothetical protein
VTAALADPTAREFLHDADPVLAKLINSRPDFRPRAWMDELPPLFSSSPSEDRRTIRERWIGDGFRGIAGTELSRIPRSSQESRRQLLTECVSSKRSG